MSQHKALARHPHHEILVGWDANLNTYFAHVIDLRLDEDDEGRDVYWVGCQFGEISDPHALLTTLSPYLIPNGAAVAALAATLIRDAG